MANARRKCRRCKQFQPADQLRTVGIQAECADGCSAKVTTKVTTPQRSRNRRNPTAPGVDAELRMQIISRDLYRCAMCGSERDLAVHHIAYRSERSVADGRDHPTNLITLCNARCHISIVHADKRRWQPLLRLYVWLLYRDNTHWTIHQLEEGLAA